MAAEVQLGMSSPPNVVLFFSSPEGPRSIRADSSELVTSTSSVFTHTHTP